MQIRHETPADYVAIRELLIAAFPTVDEANLVESLRKVGRLSLSLVAEVDSNVVGHIAFSPVTIGSTLNEIHLGLAPMAVHPDCQRQGIGGQLIQAGLDACVASNTGMCVVLGDPAYYTRFGFKPATNWHLRNEYGAGDEFMGIELVAGSAPSLNGLVRFAPEFADLGSG